MAENTKYVSSDNLAYYDALVKARDAQKGEIPTKLSQLSNDADYVKDASYVHTDSNYTSAEKTKLAGVATGAQVNVIEAVTVNGKAVTASGKTVNITVPTNNSSLTNGAGYQTAAQVKTAIEGYGYQTASQVSSAIAKAGHMTRKVVATLPTTGEDNVIYLVPAAHSLTGNVKDEYMWIDSKWEKIGSSETDLTGYVKDSDLVAMTTSEIDALFTA